MTPLQRIAVLAALLSAAGAAPAAVAPLAIKPFLVVPASVRELVRNVRLVNIPAAWRRKNWIGNRNEGSCVHTAMVHLLHWQGEHAAADRWQQQYANGENAEGLAAKLEAAGMRFGETRTGDVSFLEWCIRTRRGAAVVIQKGAHMVNLVGLDRTHAQILDSNSPERIQPWPREKFLTEWQQAGGWAVTPVGVPSAPDPWIITTPIVKPATPLQRSSKP